VLGRGEVIGLGHSAGPGPLQRQQPVLERALVHLDLVPDAPAPQHVEHLLQRGALGVEQQLVARPQDAKVAQHLALGSEHGRVAALPIGQRLDLVAHQPVEKRVRFRTGEGELSALGAVEQPAAAGQLLVVGGDAVGDGHGSRIRVAREGPFGMSSQSRFRYAIISVVAHLTRRSLLAGLGPLAAAPVVAKLAAPGAHAADAEAANGHAGHTAHGSAGQHPGAGFHENGQVDHRANGFHPTEVLRDFDEGEVTRVGGRTVRRWTLTAGDKEVEVAPGVKYAAWTFNGRIPGPTLRAREGERLQIELVNGSEHPHTIHFHGVHAPAMDGIPETGAGRPTSS
jgi:hypothetical protein